MTPAIVTKSYAATLAFIRRLGRNAEGVAAVEFGFIAPIMLLMLIGTIEISRAITIDRRFGLVTSMVADLVTTRTRLDGLVRRSDGAGKHQPAVEAYAHAEVRCRIAAARVPCSEAGEKTLHL